VHASSSTLTTIALLGLAAVACHPVVMSDPYPLYPKVDTGPGPGKVALLRGPISIVDGSAVSGKGQSFELLPGCHLVALDASGAKGNRKGNSSVNPPQVVFALEMRPGYIYTIDTRSAPSDGLSNKWQVTALEHSPDGSIVLVPRARASDVRDCRNWATSQHY
jgi:hypothetical protein